ncbi:hypothetical protein NPX13_g4542 [Xylaria arbuscula]|uniref:Uncharacterized protein n=1 Tax=Xylaria arbuscula TaxID=114810 RepID=A0A9W8TP11_9PEZI|nr:hypothetical protein NPX13_g4542 [Xylaria arbuscula]
MATHAFTQTLLGLPEPLEKGSVSLSFDVKKTASASGVATTTTVEDENIIYVDIIPTAPEAAAMLQECQNDVGLTSSFWSLKATEAVDAKVAEGKIPKTDADFEIKKSNFKIRVMEYGIQHSGWMSLQTTQNAHKKWTSETGNLHDQILKTILSGLGIPDKSLPQFENILQSISEGIKGTKSHSAEQTKWILLTLYRYDAVQNKIFATMRTIYFSVNQKQVEFTKSKKETGVNNDFELMYKQDDYLLNNGVWDGARDGVKVWIDTRDTKLVREPWDVDV